MFVHVCTCCVCINLSVPMCDIVCVRVWMWEFVDGCVCGCGRAHTLAYSM